MTVLGLFAVSLPSDCLLLSFAVKSISVLYFILCFDMQLLGK